MHILWSISRSHPCIAPCCEIGARAYFPASWFLGCSSVWSRAHALADSSLLPPWSVLGVVLVFFGVVLEFNLKKKHHASLDSHLDPAQPAILRCNCRRGFHNAACTKRDDGHRAMNQWLSRSLLSKKCSLRVSHPGIPYTRNASLTKPLAWLQAFLLQAVSIWTARFRIQARQTRDLQPQNPELSKLQQGDSVEKSQWLSG